MTSTSQTIRFCEKCDNKYYHHILNDKLSYFCRVCGNLDVNITNEGLCVLNTQYNGSNVSFEHIVNRFTKHDPTLPHIYLKCPNDKCESNKEKHVADVIYIRYDKHAMKHIYICTECNYTWKTDSNNV
jgi:DNA-directed RNA polymerase subunit M/transcription elongation factor TFIIS